MAIRSMSTGPILLVEDDRDIREALAEALSDRGYDVTASFDGVDALEALERLKAMATVPRLVLLDLMMPRMNGVELREVLTKTPEWSRIPVFVLTADARAQARAEALGVVGYLQKPVKLRELFEAVSALLPTTG